MKSQPLVTSSAAWRLGLLAIAVVATIGVAASGIVYRSSLAPALVGGGLAAAAAFVAIMRKPLWALYAALFVVMLPTGLFPASIHSNLNRALTVVAFGVWLLSVLTRRRPIKWTVTASFMSAFVLWGLVSLFWARDLSAGINAIQLYALRLVLYLTLVASEIRTEESLDGLMRTLAFIGWVLILAGLATLVLTGYRPGSRFQILEMNENEIGSLALIALPGILWQAIRSSGRQKTVNMLLSYVFVGVALAFVALSGSRGSAISFLITLSAFWLWRSTRPWAKISTVVLVIALLSMPFMFSTLTVRFAVERGDTFLGGREAIWQGALQLIRDHPWTGVGIGGAEYAVAPYVRVLRRIGGAESVSFHNPILAIWAATGVIGIALYLGALVSAVWLFIQEYYRRSRRAGDRLGPYFALISAVFLGYMPSWIKGGGMETSFSYFLLLALLLVPSCLQMTEDPGEELQAK